MAGAKHRRAQWYVEYDLEDHEEGPPETWTMIVEGFSGYKAAVSRANDVMSRQKRRGECISVRLWDSDGRLIFDPDWQPDGIKADMVVLRQCGVGRFPFLMEQRGEEIKATLRLAPNGGRAPSTLDPSR